jgi:hypothetical protein
MKFAKHHAEASIIFRILAGVLFALGFFVMVSAPLDIFQINLELVNFSDLIELTLFVLFTLICGMVAFYGQAPSWFINTEKIKRNE